MNGNVICIYTVKPFMYIYIKSFCKHNNYKQNYVSFVPEDNIN